eukprot:gnl/MRDRNA2_/MRDRNA2_98246_c0_seq1.p1 gnl/MRDRNA2_/MRDRNA2_98246_c0~~gnl/MRDRNA2_/MRDRNA2_98246_c0_seq1.p1  ORF type:complete len:720 (-),score=175.84 gnl/MRDRNA2_/MRDRNA2_98246_c0_seq1:93-2252(-)
MTVVITGISSLVLGHQKEVTTVEGESWRLNDELFLVGLLADICESKERRAVFKASCFQAFRKNETGAAIFLQQWIRRILARRAEAKAAEEAAARKAAKAAKATAKPASKPPPAPVKLAMSILPSKTSPSKESVSTPSTSTPSPKTTAPSTSLVAAGASVVQGNSACQVLAIQSSEIESPARSSRPHAITTDGPISSAGSAASSPCAAALTCGTPRSGKVTTARGENPYKRRFNPKEAARLRREKEEAERKLQEAKQKELQAAQEDARRQEDDERPSCDENAELDLANAAIATNKPPSAEDEQRLKEYGRGRAGLSMGTPQDRGPEHKPGMRALAAAQHSLAQQSSPQDPEEYGMHGAGLSMASPVGPPQSRGPPSQRQGSDMQKPQSRGPPSQRQGTADATPRRAARPAEQAACDSPQLFSGDVDMDKMENMDFAQIQKLISLGISQNESDAGFDAGYDFEDSHNPPAMSCPMPPMPRAPSETRSARAPSPRHSVTPRRSEDANETPQRMAARRAPESCQYPSENESYNYAEDVHDTMQRGVTPRSAATREHQGRSSSGWKTGDADLDDEWERRIAAGDSTPRRGRGDDATPRRGGRMAEIRAAAERRAFGAGGGRATPSRPPRPAMEDPAYAALQDQYHSAEMRALTEGSHERESRMTEIRDMAARRAQMANSGRSGDGGYQPKHCYGGRGGGNLAANLGLKFGTHEALDQQHLAISN